MALGKKNRIGYGEKKKPGMRRLVLIALVLLAGIIGYKQFLSHTLSKANHLFKEKDYVAASNYYERVSNLPFSGGRGQDGLGAIALLSGSPDQAKDHFKKILADKPSSPGADPGYILNRFIENGDFVNGELYTDFLRNWLGEKDLDSYALHFASIALGLRHQDEAASHLKKADIALKETDRYRLLNNVWEEREKSKKATVIEDRNGNPLIYWDLETQEPRFTVPELFAGWNQEEENPRSEGAKAFLAGLPEKFHYVKTKTGLDLNLQRAAAKAMEGYQGTMILMDPKSGEIRAAYGTQGMNPFRVTFEPGSVLKLITYGAYLKNGGDPSKYAPRKYPSFERIGGKIFYDWTPQGQLDTVEQGMAVSCNLMFAGMGIDVGWSKLKETFGIFFSGREQTLEFIQAYPGDINTPPEGAWELGRAAIGLDAINASSFGLVLIPAAIANSGELPQAKFALSYANFLDQKQSFEHQTKAQNVFSQETATALMRGMEEAVYFDRGTARRARTEFVQSALKTGTAGDRPFNSIMVGLLPAVNPRLAIAFYLHKGGKCEINGARVAKHLQEQINALAPEYLE